MNDPIAILVEKFAAVLIRAGKPPMVAYLEAEGIALSVLEELHQAGASVGHLLRRVQVYDLRTRGLEPCIIMQRLGISRTQVFKAYKKELFRMRYAA